VVHPSAFEELLAAARVGASWAFESLHRELAPAVAGYLRAQGAAEVEDLTSEVFLGVFRGLPRFEGDEAQLRSWVFAIAHRRLIDERRRRGRRPPGRPYESEGDTRVGGDVEEEALAALGDERVLALLDVLSADQRTVLLLRVAGDLTVEQVATAIGKRPGAVKALQRRALATLRRTTSRQGVPL
jgi:RNA polymerase sigma factor (sigma-70 family)